MKLATSICLELLDFLISFALIIKSLLVEWEILVEVLFRFLESLKTKLDCFIIFDCKKRIEYYGQDYDFKLQ